MIYKESITPQELETLPVAQFKGEITLVESLDQNYYHAIDYLSKQKIIGFDTETKPCFTANTKRHEVALLQLSGKERAFLFRLHSLGLPPELAKILSSSRIFKVGAAIHDDIKGLQRHTKFNSKGFVDLQSVAINWGITDKSVRKLAGIILGVRVSKSQQLSNWEAQELTPAQLNYAAIDAWICQKMYLKLLSTPKAKAAL
ncbi:MAG: 3'-5' exonuclease [Bacteroidales bacterium]|nr:3'-5' exonuclease domain-containing protein 2 [Bacteroidales bacterium]MDD4656296.1 3'-5' exonuclease domain-containing protein 2 [Bacteroidales bacterium]